MNSLLKSYLHLAVQYKIKGTIKSDVILEKNFKKHIADVYLEREKMVFEVQCSPISLEKVKKRNAFYASLGLHVIWILHEKAFNEKTLSPAEEYLIKKKRAYYTNVTQHQDGIIYHQKKFSISGDVIFKSPACAVSFCCKKRCFYFINEAKRQFIDWLRNKKAKKQIYYYYKEVLTSYFTYYLFLMKDRISL